MKILVLNCGSSSLKFQFVDPESGEAIHKGAFEEIGFAHSFYSIFMNGGPEDQAKFPMKTHLDAVKKLFELLGEDAKQVSAIGHRVVHGGEKYRESTVATEAILTDLEKISEFAPLHNPANISGVRACMKILPDIKNVLVFDTAFHNTLPQSSFLYAIPVEDYENFGIRRYGFHGTSYSYVAKKAAQMYGKTLEDLKIVIAHVGNGASMCAIDGGKSIDTSMGMTPLEGLVMGTRSGDIDAGAVAYLGKKRGLNMDETIDYLNKKCGLGSMAGTGGSDVRMAMAAMRDGSAQARVALDVYIHRLVKYFGAYVAVLGGVDAIVWTGGVGTNNNFIRSRVMEKLKFLGAEIDEDENKKLHGSEGGKNLTAEISKPGSRVRTFAICTNEELEIALQTRRQLGRY